VRLAICSTGEIWGGVEQCILTLTQGLSAAWMPPLVILFHEGLLARRLRERRIDVEVLGDHHKYDPRTIVRLRRILFDRRINVLHVHGYKATVIGAAAAIAMGIKVVKTEHGRLEPIPSWRDVLGHSRLSLNNLLDRIATLVFIDALVYVSRDIQNAAWPRDSRVPRRLIYNGVDLPQTLGRGCQAWAGRGLFNIGIIGRVDKVKGHADLLKALGRLTHLERIRLHVFGAGPLELECRARCRDAGLVDRVHFHGFQEDMLDHMGSLDVLVMPSLHEGLPYTLLEAMYLKVPVIASRVGGLQEVIDDGRSGMLIEARDHVALAAAIEAMYRDPQLGSRLAEEAYRTVTHQFAASGMVRRYAELYGQLAAE
jgi:glycosyltransferase involved in cell wall biosynthesis